MKIRLSFLVLILFFILWKEASYGQTTPTITASAVTGTISSCSGTASAQPNLQQFTITGVNLTGNVIATAPAGFEISPNPVNVNAFSSVVTIFQSTPGNALITIFVRAASNASPGNISGNVSVSSAGAVTQNAAVTGTVNASTVNTVANQTVATGAQSTAVNFTGSFSTVNWTNNTPGIGLAASGSGNIPAFTAVNTGTTPITATITATHTNNAGCNGTPVTFTITVNPTVGVTTPTITTAAVTGTITACSGSASVQPNLQQFTLTGANLTGNITATAPGGFEISPNPVTGYNSVLTILQSTPGNAAGTIYVRAAANASPGNISGNVLLSSAGAATQTAVVSGTVNALPTVNATANQTVATGAQSTAINFTGTFNNVNWTNTTPGIGLAASGSGGIYLHLQL
jgi:large repetitive protein